MHNSRVSYIIFSICVAAPLLVTGCSGDRPSNEKKVETLKRVVSLSPSITRQIVDLGSEDLLAGVTSYHPELERKVPVVGTLVKPNIEVITMLRPDIVLLSAEDSAVQIFDSLHAVGLRTFTFKRNLDFNSICSNYLALAGMIGKTGLAETRLEHYRHERRVFMRRHGSVRVAVFISHEPLITVGRGSYINRIIGDSGGINVYGRLSSAYPLLSVESLATENPDVIISMDKDPAEFFTRILRGFRPTALLPGHLFYLPPESMSYYTPGDYITSMKSIASLLDRIKEGH